MMLKNIIRKFNIKRIIPLFACAFFVVSSLVLNASAASVFYYDYEDWIVGDPEIVTLNNAPYYKMIVRLPTSALSLRLRYDGSQKRVVYGSTDGYPLLISENIPRNSNCSIVAGISSSDLLWGDNIAGEVAITATIGVDTNGSGSLVDCFAVSGNYNIDNVNTGTYTGAVEKNVQIHRQTSTHTAQINVDGSFGTSLSIWFSDYLVVNSNTYNFYLYDLYFTFWIPVEFRDEWHTEKLANVKAKQNMLLKNQEVLIDDMTTEQEITNDKLNDMINGTPGQSSQVDGAVGGMQNSTDKLDQMGDTLNSVEKPDPGEMNVGITDLVPETSILAFTEPILAFWENNTLLGMLIIVLTLVLVSWVMFGKKG